ncbi:N-acetylmuramoyl-L-alanine amidase [Paenibacillus sp. UNC496MF]|uniref:peptidoglycan recognition protein family protein n=1 Tax=Paenibacillus sp. UNC496MF TaxID=1502753 RepID=UPI0008E230E0|nr:peptidoglycan recognition family protein [Paenibacillus sp. UNC496MF]SFJ64944.1 N-acetylmuramoyl-L-alanine amidase [Paenibacillus sp. UNC496MF]
MSDTFLMKYKIEPQYLTHYAGVEEQRRQKVLIPKGQVRFGVNHDTGNAGSTAQNNVDFYERTAKGNYPAAHIFVDDKHIIECVPMLTAAPEKACHVLYNVKTDNAMFGEDANDGAIGVELCFGDGIDFEEAYKRYVWVQAYAAWKLNFPPTAFAGHFQLDPARKTDPVNALKRYGKTYDQLRKDIVLEYHACLNKNYGKEEEDMYEPLKYEKWQWAMLLTVMTDSNKKGQIDSIWVAKVKEEKLTPADLLFLNTILDARIDRKVSV